MHDTSESLLRSIPIFANLSPAQLSRISSALTLKNYESGEDIFVQGQPSDGLLIVLSGKAMLFQVNDDGSEEPLASVALNQFINHEALFDEVIQTATLRATQPVSMARLTRAKFANLISQRDDLRSAFGFAADESEPPFNVQFAEQRDDEEVLIHTHRHWWSFLRSAWLPLLAMPLMWIAAVILQSQLVTLALLGLSILLPGIALLYWYAEWRNDAIIVTDQRIIRIERTIVAMHKQITQVGLESVHEINFEIPAYDPFARLFRYGTVVIKTAGSQGNLELDLMPRPEQFQKLIIENRQYFENRQAKRHHDMVRAELQRWMAGEANIEQELISPSADAKPPKPIRGTNGFLSTRIMMSNGDIVYRKHISVWMQHTFVPITVVLVALTALLLTFTLVTQDLRILTFPVSMVALLIGAVTFYWLDWDWRNDIYIISDDTITLVHKRPFFLQNLRDQILVERIDNVESVSTGFFAAIMKYGDVRMSLIGADEHKLFQKISKPQEIQQEISRRQHNKEQRRARYDAIQQRQILGEYLGAANLQTLRQTADGGPADPATAAYPSNPSVEPAVDASSAQGIARATQNIDRNRPARLPRKVVTDEPRQSSQTTLPDRSAEASRPLRFRANRDSF